FFVSGNWTLFCVQFFLAVSRKLPRFFEAIFLAVSGLRNCPEFTRQFSRPFRPRKLSGFFRSVFPAVPGSQFAPWQPLIAPRIGYPPPPHEAPRTTGPPLAVRCQLVADRNQPVRAGGAPSPAAPTVLRGLGSGPAGAQGDRPRRP